MFATPEKQTAEKQGTNPGYPVMNTLKQSAFAEKRDIHFQMSWLSLRQVFHYLSPLVDHNRVAGIGGTDQVSPILHRFQAHLGKMETSSPGGPKPFIVRWVDYEVGGFCQRRHIARIDAFQANGCRDDQ